MDIASAPASSDNATVILWVVGALMVGMSTVLALFYGKIKENEKKCADEATRCDEERRKYLETSSGHHRKVEAIYQKIIEDKEESSKTKSQMLAENMRVLDRNSTIIEKLLDGKAHQ